MVEQQQQNRELLAHLNASSVDVLSQTIDTLRDTVASLALVLERKYPRSVLVEILDFATKAAIERANVVRDEFGLGVWPPK